MSHTESVPYPVGAGHTVVQFTWDLKEKLACIPNRIPLKGCSIVWIDSSLVYDFILGNENRKFVMKYATFFTLLNFFILTISKED